MIRHWKLFFFLYYIRQINTNECSLPEKQYNTKPHSFGSIMQVRAAPLERQVKFT